MRRHFSLLFGILFTTVVFSHPFLLWSQYSYLSGQFSVWSSFFLAPQNFILLALLFLSIYYFFQKKILRFIQVDKALLFLLIWLLCMLFWVKDPMLHFLFTLQLALFFFAFSTVKRVENWQKIFHYFLYSMLFVGVVTLLQILLQQSIGFHFLGEPFIASDVLGVAKIDVGNEKFIRAYGTFLHPNILAFFSLMAFYLTEYVGWKRLKWLFIFLLLLTFSRAGLLAFVVSYFLFQKRSKQEYYIFGGILLFALFIFTQQLFARLNILDAAFFERIGGITTSLKMFLQYPFGVGIGHYTLHMQAFSSSLQAWEFQPVHNVYLLLFNEIGVIGIALLTWFIATIWKRADLWQKQVLIALAVLGIFDHYIWTSYNVLIFVWFFLFFIYFSKKS